MQWSGFQLQHYNPWLSKKIAPNKRKENSLAKKRAPLRYLTNILIKIIVYQIAVPQCVFTELLIRASISTTNLLSPDYSLSFDKLRKQC